MEMGIGLIRAPPKIYVISDNPNVSLGVADCLLYNRRVTLEDGRRSIQKANGYTNSLENITTLNRLPRRLSIPSASLSEKLFQGSIHPIKCRSNKKYGFNGFLH